MMTPAMNPVTTAKTAEILSRYRPIAPKPEIPISPPDSENAAPTHESPRIKQSPYLRNVWSQMQARPTRTRKRGRTALALPPPAIKRPRTHHLFTLTSPGQNLSFAHGLLPLQSLTDKLTLPLLPCPILAQNAKIDDPNYVPFMTQNTSGELNFMEDGEKGLDLNRSVAENIPEEKDLLQQLQGPISPSVIAPQPVRPVGSSISVGCINEELGSTPPAQIPKKRQEVEEEVESEALPAVVSDSNNKVRLANSAYKEMVGQPECSWLDSSGAGGGTCSRICGEVMLQFADQQKNQVAAELKSTDSKMNNGFSCWVTIQWGGIKGKNTTSVHAFCEVIKLACESKDYAFEWRFHTRQQPSRSSSNSNA